MFQFVEYELHGTNLRIAETGVNRDAYSCSLLFGKRFL